MCRSGTPIGRVGEESYPHSVQIISKYPIPLGTYIAIPFEAYEISANERKQYCAIGVISLTAYRKLIPTSPTFIASSTQLGIDDENLRYSPSRARIFANIVGDRIETPSVPPNPDAEVYLAPSEILARMFTITSAGSIRIGHVIGRSDVEVKVNVNVLTKHLFITGTTGSGKSNAVAILAERIAGIGGTAIIFDVHGEYINMTTSSPDINIHVIDFKFNPLKIPPKVLAKMIIPEAGATRQRALTSNALQIANTILSKFIEKYGVSEDLMKAIMGKSEEVKRILNPHSISVEDLVKNITVDEDLNENIIEIYKNIIILLFRKFYARDDSAAKAQAKVEEFFDNIPLNFASSSLTDLLRPSSIFVVNASDLSDEQKDYCLKIILDEMLNYTRHRLAMGRPHPVIIFIEESHRFLSATRSTVSKSSIERVAREGRKFGVSLAIVSQRPRNLDPNTVSQVQNFIFMKLVQEEDQRFVMNVSDMLTEDVALSLSALNTGEAIIIGEWVGRFPIYAKIDRHTGKKLGASLDIASIWLSTKSNQNAIKSLAASSNEVYKELSNIM
uniref:ATP-binding protein n=1 Tax=Ignisphaera aggregans TaxID=334771 RepID=A0A7J2U017_9CREN